MTNERAIEILEHMEHYESLELVEEACRMGMEALKARIPAKCEKTSTDTFYLCASCKRIIAKYEQSHGKIKIPYCKWGGQALDWGG